MNEGSKIRELRKSKGISMKQLGSMIGVSEQAISQYERGLRKIPLENKVKIAKALDIPLNELHQATDETINDLVNMLPNPDDNLSIDEAVKKYIDVIDLGGKICNPDYDNNIETRIKVKEAYLKALEKAELLNKILEFHNLSYKMNCNSDGSRSYFISDNQDSINKEISEDDFIDFENRILWSIEKEIEYFKKFYMKDNT